MSWTREEANQIIAELTQGGMINHAGVQVAVNNYITTNDPRPLQRVLKANPHILLAARRNIASRQIQQAVNPYMPFPSLQDIKEKLSGALAIGWANPWGGIFGIAWEMLLRILIVLGRIGTGKSQLLKNIVVQALNLYSRSFNLLILDPQKREYRALLNLYPHLKLLPRERVRINPFQPVEPSRIKEHLVNTVEVIIAQGFFGDLSRSYLVESLTELYQEKGCFDGSENWPTMRELHQRIGVKLEKYKGFGTGQDVLKRLKDRLAPYLESEVFNCRKGITIQDLTREDWVIELDDMSPNVINFLVGYISRMIYRYNVHRGLIDAQLRTLIIVDEARTVAAAHRNLEISEESTLVQDATRMRAPGVAMIYCSHEPNSIHPTIRSMAMLRIAFPLSDGVDVRHIAESWRLNEEQTNYYYNINKLGRAVVRYPAYERPFLIDVPYFDLGATITDTELAMKMADTWREVESRFIPDMDDITVTTASAPPPKADLPIEAQAFLFQITKQPFTPKAGHAQSLFNTRDVDRLAKLLSEKELVEERKFPLSATNYSAYLVLTRKGFNLLQPKDYPDPSRFEHTLYQDIILARFNATGWKATLEGRMRDFTKAIDVLALKDNQAKALEVTIHNDNIIDNILGDFESGVTEVVVVTRDAAAKDEAIRIVDQWELAPELRAKITFALIRDFMPPKKSGGANKV